MSLNDLSHEQLIATLDQRKLRPVEAVSFASVADTSTQKKERAACSYEQEQANDCIAQVGMYISTNGLLQTKCTDKLVKRVRDANLKSLKDLDRQTKDEFIKSAITWLRQTNDRNRWST